MHYGPAAQRDPAPAFLALIAPPALYPKMFLATAFTFHPDLVPLFLEMLPTGLFAPKMCRKIE
ncbi:hypothetical protein BFP75_09185 [Maribacter sp. 4G9]|nr:hypothetical protein BFP75_09185 [Maribacter sp. 4G9]